MQELSYDVKHFQSGTYTGSVTTPEKLTLPLLATLHFDAETGKISGEMEDHHSGKVDVTGTFNKNAPYDFKIQKADTTYNGFRQNLNLIGRYKTAAGKGVFQLTPERIIAQASSGKPLGQEETIQELIGMGFSEEASRQAVVVKGLALSEAAEYLVNPDESTAAAEILIERFKGMGFPHDKIEAAVAQCEGKEEVALQYLLEQTDDVPQATEE